jgi:glycerol-3-phosphate dehydrogenase
MRRIQTDILVIGGGATGTGVLRDLAMRGFKCILVERRDLAYGTTGRYHGLLHSGGRYVVKDPQAARECYQENLILRRIMPQCIEDTGGFFVSTPYDNSDYIPRFLDGCRLAGIPAETIRIEEMLKEEPFLDPKIYHCVRVPDAAADSFLAAQLNAESARLHNAIIMTYHEFRYLLVTESSTNGHKSVSGAYCHDLIKDEDVEIDASMVINASGAWAGKVLETAGIGLQMVPGKGTMLAVNHRIVNTVINRCKPPSDGDILVPTHTVAVIGTTDIKVADPDHYAIEPWEIRLMLEEGEKIYPGFKQLRILRAWAGVRPLVQVSGASNNREISRSFVLLDHAERDGVSGVVTITSGKWTTYRKMAEVTVDKVCEKLNVRRPCRTHLEPLPNSSGEKNTFYLASHRLDDIERNSKYGNLVCECELVTIDELKKAIIESNTVTLDDVRRDTRLGMGPCQGAFCSFRAAGVLHELRQSAVDDINNALCDFLEERWKGDLPILFGKQIQQARFNEFIYVDILNATRLPSKRDTAFAADLYEAPQRSDGSIQRQSPPIVVTQTQSYRPMSKEVIVIGAGFSGLTTAWQLAKRGKSVSVISRGWGTPYWSSGCIDIIGYKLVNYQEQVSNPREYLEKLIQSNPEHPYAIAGMPAIEGVFEAYKELSQEAGYPLHGALEENIFIPTALGTLRPTCLVPPTMVSANIAFKTPMLIVGFEGFIDFFPGLIAGNLEAQGILAEPVSLDLPSLQKRKLVTGMVLARLFDNENFREEVIHALKPRLGNSGRIGFPAVLGVNHPMQVMEHLESELGAPVFEIPGLPPSVPGIRLHKMLVEAMESHHGSVINGTSVVSMSLEGNAISSVWSVAASRQQEHPGKEYVLATGGILGGGTFIQNTGYTQETIFNLQGTELENSSSPLSTHFIDNPGQPIFRTGIQVDLHLRPSQAKDGNNYSNLYVVGNALANCDAIRERSLEGVALATGYRVAQIISENGSK